MKRLAFLAILLTAWFCAPAHAQFNGCSSFCGTSSSAVVDGPGFNNNQASSVATCTPGTQATNFLARTSGLSGAETTAYCNLINGLVTDGIITGTLSGAAGCGTVLDALYIVATNTTATANLNLCGTSFGLTQTGTVTFTADVGYAGDGSTGFLSTGYQPSVNGVNFLQNSASIGAYVQTNRAANTSIIMGCAVSATVFSLLQHFSTGNVVQWDVNDATFPTVANPSSQGALVATRTAAAVTAIYRNGNVTALGTSTAASLTPPNQTMVFFGLNTNGTTGSFSSDQASAFFMGGAMTATQAVAINNRINTYMTALGHNVY